MATLVTDESPVALSRSRLEMDLRKNLPSVEHALSFGLHSPESFLAHPSSAGASDRHRRRPEPSGGLTLQYRPTGLVDLGSISKIAVPQLQWGLLDFGRTSAAMARAHAGRDEAEAQYRQVVLGPLQHSESSLSRVAK